MSEEAVALEVAQPPPPQENTEETADASPVAENGGGPPRRVQLGEQQLQAATKEDMLSHWKEQDAFIDAIETQATVHEGEITNLRESLEKMKQQHAESQHREKVLVRRLASKEQEMQDYASQLAELRAAQVPSAAALRSALLDPAASLLVQKLRQELAATKTRLEETQNELSAWKFTPDSNTGKRLMAKCRLLYQENEELGRVIASGRLAKLEGELALQKSFSDEVKKSQSELDEFLQELDEDVEGMQGTIYFLQQQLKSAKETVASLTAENHTLRQAQQGEEGDDGEKEIGWGEEGTTQDSTSAHIEDEGSSQAADQTEEPMEEGAEKQDDNATPEPGESPATSPAPAHEESPPNKRARLDSEDQPEENATE